MAASTPAPPASAAMGTIQCLSSRQALCSDRILTGGRRCSSSDWSAAECSRQQSLVLSLPPLRLRLHLHLHLDLLDLHLELHLLYYLRYRLTAGPCRHTAAHAQATRAAATAPWTRHQASATSPRTRPAKQEAVAVARSYVGRRRRHRRRCIHHRIMRARTSARSASAAGSTAEASSSSSSITTPARLTSLSP